MQRNTEGREPSAPGEKPSSARLPSGLRLLCICRQEPGWTGLTLQLDRLGCREPRFRWCGTQAAAAAVLHEEGFDAIIIGEPDPADTDPVVFIEALRLSGCDDPIVLLSPRSDDAWLLRCSELDVELLPAAAGWDSRALAHWMQRAVLRTHLARDQQRLRLSERRLQEQDRERSDEVVRRLQQMAARAAEAEPAPAEVIDRIRPLYRELLRTAALVGHDRLDAPVRQLVDECRAAGLSPCDTLRLHADSLAQLVHGLGNRSVRHIQSQADLLALDVLVQYAEALCARRRAVSLRSGLADYGLNLLEAGTLPPRSTPGE
jgi:hypothetical protein